MISKKIIVFYLIILLLIATIVFAEEIKSGDTITLKSNQWDKYCSSWNDELHLMQCNRSVSKGVDAWEKFTIEKVGGSGGLKSGDIISLKSNQWNTYCSSWNDDVHSMRCDASASQTWEKFTIEKVGGSDGLKSGDTISLKSNQWDKYCSSWNDHVHLMRCNATHVLGWENFTIEFAKTSQPEQTTSQPTISPPISAGPQSGAALSQCVDKQVAKTNIPGCQDSQRCKEIDEVWSQKIGPITSNNLQVWDPQTNSWNGFDNVYYTIQQVCGPAQTVSSGTGSMGVSPTGVDYLAMSGGDPYLRAFMRMISVYEGTSKPCKEGVSPYQIVVGGEITETSKNNPRYGGVCGPFNYFIGFNGHPEINIKWNLNQPTSSAAGKYQFVSKYWPNFAKHGNGVEDFSPVNQDLSVHNFLKVNGIDQLLHSAGSNPDSNSESFKDIWQTIMEKKGIGKQWASLPYACYENQPCYGRNDAKFTESARVYVSLLREELGGTTSGGTSTTPSPKPATTPSKLPDEVKADGSCPAGMVKITNFCIDQYENSLIDKSTAVAWSPYNLPRNNIGNLKAVSVANVVPQGYISGIQAAQACKNSGKNLCTQTQWLRACQGSDGRKFPYVEEEDKTKCNYGKPHPDVRTAETIQNRITTKYTTMTDPGINREYDLAPTGQYSNCVTPEGVYDLVGNLQEWVDDGDLTNPGSLFGGGYYGATLTQLKINGGCGFQKTSHSGNQNDYSLGFRCCANPTS